MTNDEYKEFAGQHAPRSRAGRNMLRAFVSGGAICAVGQALTNLYLSLGMEMDSACAVCSAPVTLSGVGMSRLNKYGTEQQNRKNHCNYFSFHLFRPPLLSINR